MTDLSQPIPPGETIQDELRARRWTQLELAKRTNIIPEAIHGVIEGTWRITPTMAERFAEVFGTSEELWMTLEANYRAELAKRKGSN